MHTPTTVELRRGVLAVSVLCDVDAEPGRLGVALPGSPPVLVPWGECLRALGGRDPESEAGRSRLSAWLLARRWAADAGPDLLTDLLRPVGLPVGHLLHPGLDWVCERVLGEALDLGFGAVGLCAADPDAVVLLPRTALDAAGLSGGSHWPRARRYLEDMGALAAERLSRDPRGQLRPVGDCDVVTLLGARSLRAGLVGADGGMTTAVVPMRRCGWTRLTHIDPAFGPAAAAATEPTERGFARPLLVTVDEVTVVPAGGRPGQTALQGPAAGVQWARDALQR